MKTQILEKAVLPVRIPHGLINPVALRLGIHRNTVKNRMKVGKGALYDQIVHTASEMSREHNNNKIKD